MICAEVKQLMADKQPWECTRAELGAFMKHCHGCKECEKMVLDNAERAARDCHPTTLLYSHIVGQRLAQQVMDDPEARP